MEQLTHRKSWMPDPGVYMYVKDLMSDVFGVDITKMPDYWVPIGILGTLEAVAVMGWWHLKYTGLFETGESYNWVFTWADVYEFDPEMLEIFQEDETRNQYGSRLNSPDLTPEERRDISSFLRQNAFPRFGKEPPENDYIDAIVWCTLMWVLSPDGRAWLVQKDPTFSCVEKYGVAYRCGWDGELLDPESMVCTKRTYDVCGKCGNKLTCVLGYCIDDSWRYICNSCAVDERDSGAAVDMNDPRIMHPHCVHHGGNCVDPKCPHHYRTKEELLRTIMDAGSQRLQAYSNRMLEQGETRMISDKSLEDIVSYFK